MFRADRSRIEVEGRRANSALRVHEALKARPLRSLPNLRDETGLSSPTVASAMDLLVEAGIAEEITGHRRNCVYAYREYLAILNDGTELP